MDNNVSDQHVSMLAFYVAVAWVCLAGTGPWTRLPSALSFAMVTLFICLIVLIDFLSAGRRVNLVTPRFLEHAMGFRRKMRQLFGRCIRVRFHALPWLRRRKRQRTADGADTELGMSDWTEDNIAVPFRSTQSSA